MAFGNDYEVIFSINGGDTFAERINVRPDKGERASNMHFRQRLAGSAWLGFPKVKDVEIQKYREL